MDDNKFTTLGNDRPGRRTKVVRDGEVVEKPKTKGLRTRYAKKVVRDDVFARMELPQSVEVDKICEADGVDPEDVEPGYVLHDLEFDEMRLWCEVEAIDEGVAELAWHDEELEGDDAE